MLTDPLLRSIESLLARNPGQLTQREYCHLAELVSARANNLLVFGVGLDSGLWLQANPRGKTVFIESSATWAHEVAAELPAIEIHLVDYGTRRSQWRELLAGDPVQLELRLPAGLAETAWDTIFVDGPAGFDDDSPGRMKSICTAAALARRHGRGEVIVHDCDREVERRCCDRFFFAAELVTAFDRTRHYRIQPDDL